MPNEEPDFVARAASTRFVSVGGKQVRFAPQALTQTIDTVRSVFIPMHLEHLNYLPPIARWYDGALVEEDDGELELLLFARRLERTVIEPSDYLGQAAELATDDVDVAPTATLLVEPRKLRRGRLGRTGQRGAGRDRGRSALGCAASARMGVVIPVVWGLAKFATGFFEELGAAFARNLSEWLPRSAETAKGAERDRLLTLRFDLPDGGFVSGHIPVAADDPDPVTTIGRALDESTVLARFAGAQAEKNLIPGLRRISYVFDGRQWQLAWLYKGGDEVLTTRWLDEHGPDPSRFLGAPLVADITGQVGGASFGQLELRRAASDEE